MFLAIVRQILEQDWARDLHGNDLPTGHKSESKGQQLDEAEQTPEAALVLDNSLVLIGDIGVLVRVGRIDAVT